MKILKNGKQLDFSSEEFLAVSSNFIKVFIDLGTGDGRFIYEKALANKDTLCVGIEPAEKQLSEFCRKVTRNKISNLIYVVGSYETYPKELFGFADAFFVIFPWGSLLKAVGSPTDRDIESFKTFIKSKGTLEIIFGYDSEAEPTEVERLALHELTPEYIKSRIIDVFEHQGNFKLLTYSQLDSSEIRNIPSTWGKRISFGKPRSFYRFLFKKISQ